MIRAIASSLLATLVLVLTVGAPPAAAEQRAGLVAVPAEHVCMMNDKRFPEPQIPVEVDGRTYYGCCAMCKERLATDAAARTAIDPVSRRPVDKATAVIGAATDGRVFYFESAANRAAYSPPTLVR